MRRAQYRDGRRSRPGRGLSLDRIVAATLELVDEQGIGAASMRAVSSRLGVRSMSLYRYVRDRDELLDAVVERIVNELADDPEVQLRPVDGWRPYLSGMARGVRRYALAHPHAFPLVATRPPGAPWVNPPLRSLRWVEAMLTGLARRGFQRRAGPVHLPHVQRLPARSPAAGNQRHDAPGSQAGRRILQRN